MDKNDILLLKIFMTSSIPKDFDTAPNRSIMIDSLRGLADRLLHREKILKQEVKKYDLDKETKKNICAILNSLENLQFYYLLKLIIVILYKYSI